MCIQILENSAAILLSPRHCHNTACFRSQNQQLELDLLLERVNEISKHADKRNKDNIARQSQEVSDDWSSLVTDLEKRRDALTKLAEVWETFEGRWQSFESVISAIDEKAKHVDCVVRDRQHVENTRRTFEVGYGFVVFLKNLNSIMKNRCMFQT